MDRVKLTVKNCLGGSSSDLPQACQNNSCKKQVLDCSGRSAEEKNNGNRLCREVCHKKQKQYFASVLISGVALGGLIASHGRPHVAALSFSGRSVKFASCKKTDEKKN